jgi:hypothetical protein
MFKIGSYKPVQEYLKKGKTGFLQKKNKNILKECVLL